jgi:UDP-glucuronate 4-epimerase
MTVSAPILVTGAAGFIGFHMARRLLTDGWDVVGLDNLNDYYDPTIKRARLRRLSAYSNFLFEERDLTDRWAVRELFSSWRFKRVLHLAAQAGVRHSIEHPEAYVGSNLVGFLNVLEGCRKVECEHLVYASSSSVYGANTHLPWRTSDIADHPLSLYGATKRANELMAHAYAHLFGIPATGLRFFTVYGPWGRPDMALWLFTAAIMQGKPVRLYNNGRMRRDFTYIDDVVETVVRLIGQPPTANERFADGPPDPASSTAQWRIYNIGNCCPIELLSLVSVIEHAVGRSANIELLPIQPGDVVETCADSSDLEKVVGFKPTTSIEAGVRSFVEWFREFEKMTSRRAMPVGL